MDLYEIQLELKEALDHLVDVYWRLQWEIGEQEDTKKAPE